jgi:hypothetical protein
MVSIPLVDFAKYRPDTWEYHHTTVLFYRREVTAQHLLWWASENNHQEALTACLEFVETYILPFANQVPDYQEHRAHRILGQGYAALSTMLYNLPR